MAYQVKKRDSYRWTVEHVLEIRDGKPELMVFDAEFKVLPKKHIEELLSGVKSIKDAQFMDEVLVELHGLEGEGKVYRKADINELADLYPGLLGSLGTAWGLSVLGGGAARKNS